MKLRLNELQDFSQKREEVADIYKQFSWRLTLNTLAFMPMIYR